MSSLDKIRKQITQDPENTEFAQKGWQPLFSGSPQSKIVIIGQAPGIKAQESNIPWNDASGETLRQWLGVTADDFYDTSKFALVPMDFYYPGKNPKGGDLPPRPEFAKKWHEAVLAAMPETKLVILVGSYAQKYYLGKDAKRTLTENVRSFADYLPRYFPVVHPSPLTGRWRAQNPWFENNTIVELQKKVAVTLTKSS